MTRILITGTRDADAVSHHLDMIKRVVMRAVAPVDDAVTLVHGACPTGVDAFIDELCADPRWGYLTVERHPADWDLHGRAAGPIRNVTMVALRAEVCLAFPYRQSSGTYDCAIRAAKAGIVTHIHPLTGA